MVVQHPAYLCLQHAGVLHAPPPLRLHEAAPSTPPEMTSAVNSRMLCRYPERGKKKSSMRPLGYVFLWANEQLVRGNVLWKKLLSDVGRRKEANEQLVI